MAEERKSVGVALLSAGFHAQAVGLERFERGRGHLFDRSVEFLNGAERLAQVFAQGGGRFAKCLQNVLATVGLGLLAAERISRSAIDRLQPDNVTAAEAGD